MWPTVGACLSGVARRAYGVLSRPLTRRRALPSLRSSRDGTLGPLEAETCRDYVVPRLLDAGWSLDQIVEQYPITDGRIVVVGEQAPARRRRSEPTTSSSSLLASLSPSSRRSASTDFPADGLQQGEALRGAARPAARLLDERQGHRRARLRHRRSRPTTSPRFRRPSRLWARYRAWKGIIDDDGADGAPAPVQPCSSATRTARSRSPATTSASRSTAPSRRSCGGDKRVLLTMATGTGKTFVALQIVWKLLAGQWRRRAASPGSSTSPTGTSSSTSRSSGSSGPSSATRSGRSQGEAKTGREIYFALYQALADSGDEPRHLPRLSARLLRPRHRRRVPSRQRARRVDLAGDPRALLARRPARHDRHADARRDRRHATSYFGDPIFEYSLAQGIDDGFLAPVPGAARRAQS